MGIDRVTPDYDYVIVGAGLYGAVFAYEATARGFSCLVVESRDHIGGNCYTKKQEGVNVHVYGPHIFHTNSKDIWDYVNQFAEFNNFTYRPKAQLTDGKLYSFPINMMTLYQVYGARTPEEGREAVSYDIRPMKNDNLEEWAISQIGTRLYEMFIKEYTAKQWGKDPKDLPSSIIKRLPIRYTFDDNYFTDKYQGIPIGGYTRIFEKLLFGSSVLLNTRYTPEISKRARRKIIYTGPIDAYFGYRLGQLEYRSLRFESEVREGDYQGIAVINSTGHGTSRTRSIEHKHFENPENPMTVVTREYPDKWDITKVPYYPIETDRNKKLYQEYTELAKTEPNVWFRGRLGTYKYFDMHQILGMALKDVRDEFGT